MSRNNSRYPHQLKVNRSNNGNNTKYTKKQSNNECDCAYSTYLKGYIDGINNALKLIYHDEVKTPKKIIDLITKKEGLNNRLYSDGAYGDFSHNKLYDDLRNRETDPNFIYGNGVNSAMYDEGGYSGDEGGYNDHGGYSGGNMGGYYLGGIYSGGGYNTGGEISAVGGISRP